VVDNSFKGICQVHGRHISARKSGFPDRHQDDLEGLSG
jgi:hypothetical protein